METTVMRDKYNELFDVSKDIADSIESLNKEVSVVESLYLKVNMIENLKKENEELEKLIGKYIKELGELEIANGRKQMSPCMKSTCKGDTTKEKVPSTKHTEPKSQVEEFNNRLGLKTEKKEIKKEEKQSEPASKKGSSKKPPATEEVLPVDIGRLDMRVGRIIEIKKHDDADSLYVEKVDIGAAKPITVVSGLVKHITMEELENRLVIILCNLKPAKMRGVLSEGMVMCASTPEKVEVLSPDISSKPGDSVSVKGYPPPPNGPEPILNPKKKVFEILAPELMTDDECFASFRGVRWEVPCGFVKSSTLAKVNIK